MKTAQKANMFMLGWLLCVPEIMGQILETEPRLQQLPPLVFQVVTHTMMFLVPCLIALWVWRKDWRAMLPLRGMGWKNAGMVVLLMVLAQPIMMFVSALSTLLFENTTATAVGGMAAQGGLWPTMLVIAVLPAILEEVMFRGILLAGYRRQSIWVAVLVNGLFFGMMHLNPQQFLYAFLLGMLFTYMVRCTRSLWTGILAHFMVNGMQTLLLFATMTATEVAAEESAAELAASPIMMWAEANPVLFAVLLMLGASIVVAPFFGLLLHAFHRHNQQRNALADAVAVRPETAQMLADAAAIGVIGAADANEQLNTAAAMDVSAEVHRPFDWTFWIIIILYAFLMLAPYILPRG